jgi:hypothetical protein
MSYSPQAFTTATTANLGEIKVGSGFTVAGDGTLNNGGVTQLTGAATIKVSAATGPITLTDVGVFSVTGGTGITTNVTTGSVTVTNAGVTAFNGSTGAVLGVASITGTSNQITASASTGAVTLSLPQSIATTNTPQFAGLYLSGLFTATNTTEVAGTKTSATGTVDHDFSAGAVWLHSSVSANFTINFTNMPTVNLRAMGVTLIITQGATAYLPTAAQVGGSATTINWANNIVPTGTANRTDIVSFTLVYASSTWTIYGSVSSY